MDSETLMLEEYNYESDRGETQRPSVHEIQTMIQNLYLGYEEVEDNFLPSSAVKAPGKTGSTPPMLNQYVGSDRCSLIEKLPEHERGSRPLKQAVQRGFSDCGDLSSDLKYQSIVTKKSRNETHRCVSSQNVETFITHMAVLGTPNPDHLRRLLTARRRETLTKVLSLEVYQLPGALSIWKALCDILRALVIYGLNVTLYKAQDLLHNALVDFVDLAYEKDRTLQKWIPVVKYRLAHFAVWAKDSEFSVPNRYSRPSSHLPFKDKQVRGFFLKMKKEDYPRFLSLVDSVARGVKKGCDRPDSELCEASKADTFKKFTTKKGPSFVYVEETASWSGEVGQWLYTENDFREQVTRTVKEVVRPVRALDFGHFPSTSSSVESSVKDGGQFAHIHSRMHDKGFTMDPRCGIHLASNFVFKKQGIHEVVGDPICREPLKDEVFAEICESVEYGREEFVVLTPGDDANNFSVEQIEELATEVLQEPGRMTLVALSEALKIRGISKGNALENWLLKPIQKELASQLLSHEVFKLTGTPLTEDHINRMFGHLPLDTKFLSGDYEDATNEMRQFASRHCIRACLARMGLTRKYPKLCQLAERSLCDNLVNYTVSREERGKLVKDLIEGRQYEAQPMGKVLSFVCLCIINLSVCRWVCEKDQNRRIAVKQFVGFINGDDCVFPLQKFSLWEQFSPLSGLKNSIGKTFWSHLIEMNSMSFVRSSPLLGPVIGGFRYVPYINFGLLRGLKRSAECGAKSHPLAALTNIGAQHEELVDRLDEFYTPLTDLFLQERYKVLHHEEVKGIPWFVPCWLGGLGLKPAPDLSNFSEFDRQVCKAVFSNYNSEGRTPEHVGVEPEWLIHRVVNRQITSVTDGLNVSQFEYFGDGSSIAESFQEVYNYLVAVAWRTQPFEQLFQSGETVERATTRRVRAALQRNRAVRTAAVADVLRKKNPKPLEWHKIWHEPQIKIRPIRLQRAGEKEGSLCCIQVDAIM
jgi:hypothetical protein